MTTPRSGSFLLCEGLEATGVAGIPREYAPADDLATWCEFHRCSSHVEYFYRFPELCRTPNGVFGAKLMWLQYVAWAADARRYLRRDMSSIDVLESIVGRLRFIRLTRRDVLRQAISWIRAQATGVWSIRDGDQTYSHIKRLPNYDPLLLRQSVEKLKFQQKSWDLALQSIRAPTLDITYEQLSANYEATIDDVLGFLGLTREGPLPQPMLKRQADEFTEEWVTRALRSPNDFE